MTHTQAQMRIFLNNVRMRSGILAIFIFLSFTSGEVLAASKYKVVESQGLIEIDSFSQWITLGYGYSGTTSDTTVTRHHRYKETYSLSTGGGIIDPRVTRFSLRTDIKARQNNFTSNSAATSSSKNVDLAYQFNVLAFEREIHPILFSSYLQETFVSDSFQPSYNLTTSGNHLTTWYKNKIVPFRFDVSHTTTATDGLVRDSSSSTNRFSLNASNNFRNRSYSEFAASHQTQTRESALRNIETTTNQLSLTNSFTFDSKGKYSLGSGLSGSKSEQQDNPSSSFNLREDFKARFGSALEGQASYNYDLKENTSFAGEQQQLTTHSVLGRLYHRLFLSLETTIEERYRQSQFLGGEENETATLLKFDYRKNLPKDSQLGINLSGEHKETERSVLGAEFDIPEEEHFGVVQGDIIQLRTSGTVVEVVSVKRLDPNLDFFYARDFDYIVDEAAGTIEIVFGGGIIDGTDIVVAYTVEVDGHIKFLQNNYAIGSNLSLYSGKYKIKGRFSLQDQRLISGESASDNWGIITTALLRGEVKHPYQRYVLEFAEYNGISTAYQYVEGGWYYSRPFSRSSLSAQIRNRYTIYDSTAVSRPAYSVNSLLVGGGYRRVLSSWGSLQLSADYVDLSGKYLSSQRLFFRAGLQGKFNKLVFNLTGTTLFRIANSRSVRSDTLLFDVTRYF